MTTTPTECPHCADKDLILAGLKRINEQLSSECDRMHRLLSTAPKNPNAGPAPQGATEGGGE
jgi:hypothetical protein